MSIMLTIRAIEQNDLVEWKVLYKKYLMFYKTELTETLIYRVLIGSQKTYFAPSLTLLFITKQIGKISSNLISKVIFLSCQKIAWI